MVFQQFDEFYERRGRRRREEQEGKTEKRRLGEDFRRWVSVPEKRHHGVPPNLMFGLFLGEEKDEKRRILGDWEN